MATLVLTTVGAIVGGPIGASIGALAGSSIDRMLFAPKGRSGPRLDDLTVQSSAYGMPHPRLFGTTRAAGNVIWSRGLKESTHRSGGGKSSGGRTTTYSYSASFAVAISARPIVAIGRIWADGKPLRNASGEMTAEGAVRIYTGSETQAPDPLIVAAEGIVGAPAYRGLAYAVFEDLQLGDFANRIPNLSFEVIADGAPPTVAEVLGDLCTAAGAGVSTAGLTAPVPGFAAASNAPLSTWVEALSELAPVRVLAGTALRLHDVADESGIVLTREWLADGERRHAVSRRTADAPAAMTFGYLDPARDYLAGTQRAFHPGARGREAHAELPVAFSSAEAKRAAQAMLQRQWTLRETAEFRLGYRAIGLLPGDRVTDAAGRGWEVRRTSIETMTVVIEAEPVLSGGDRDVEADGGRADIPDGAPQGDTHFHVFELPPIGSEAPALPRLWIAAAGSGAGWRRAEIWLSRDAGVSWTSIGMASGAVPMGTALDALPDADPTRWDMAGEVEVELIADSWLESRPPLSVLAGANMALIGGEIVQFQSAEATAPGRFRLSGLLRGRRGTEVAVAGHAAGERFVLLDTAALYPLDMPVDAIGGEIMVRLVPPNRAAADSPTHTHFIEGRALQPLAPVHLRAAADADGGIRCTWIRRSRVGFGWIDGADVPLGEEREAYAVRCIVGDSVIAAEVTGQGWIVGAGAQLSAFGLLPEAVRIEVRQLSAATGPGVAASGDFTLAR